MSGVRVPSVTPSCIAGDLRVDRILKFFLADWLEFWLGHLCDVDHMEFRGVWCRTALPTARTIRLGGLPISGGTYPYGRVSLLPERKVRLLRADDRWRGWL